MAMKHISSLGRVMTLPYQMDPVEVVVVPLLPNGQNSVADDQATSHQDARVVLKCSQFFVSRIPW